MTILFPTLLLITYVLIVPAWLTARKDRRWDWWDFLPPFNALLAWILLTGLGIGSQSLANIIEVLFLMPLIILMIYLRVLVLDRRWAANTRRHSSLVLILSVLIPLVLRLSMPILPE